MFLRVYFRWLRRAAVVWIACCLIALIASPARAYVLEGSHWPFNQPIVIDLQLGAPNSPLFDGSASWNDVARTALDMWNVYLGDGVQFQAISTGNAPVEGDHANTVFFSSTIYGEKFGSDTLAITLIFSQHATGITTETDVLFNTAKSFNSYRGAVRYNSAGRMYDLRRVALHEFGHVLGLDHVPRDSASIMTPNISEVETVLPDDTAGIASLYGPPSAANAPVIGGDLSLDAQLRKSFTYQITASHAPTSYLASGLPPGVLLEVSTGKIIGIPTATGIYNVAISATNGVGTGTGMLVITVVDGAPVITSAITASATVGQPFSYQIVANHFASSFDATGLPGGLSIDGGTGVISGIPTAAGVFPVILQAINGVGTGTATLTLTVALTDATFATIHRFDSGPDGSNPSQPLVLGRDGNFYGVTSVGGVGGFGTIFRLTRDGTLTTIYRFTNAAGPRGLSALTPDADGNLYGTTSNGGDNSFGVVFKLTPDGQLSVLHSFTQTENSGGSQLIQARDGNFYGSTAFTIFKLTPDGTFSVLRAFSFYDFLPPTPLIEGSDGNLYAATYGSLNSNGTVIKVTPSGDLTVMHRFTGQDGSYPSGPLLLAADGNFYGTTNSGGANNYGTFFRMTPDGTLIVLHSFGSQDGIYRNALVQGEDGNFYGSAVRGGPGYTALTPPPSFVPQGKGALFKLSPTGRFTLLHIFDGTDGTNPSGLLLGGDGFLYGTTNDFPYDSPPGPGTVFKRALDGADVIPTVTLEATTPRVSASSGGAAVFTLKLSEPATGKIKVHYTVKGSAVGGTDYLSLSGTKKIKAGKTSQAIKVMPLGNLGGAGKKTVVLTLQPGDGYTVGTTGKVKVKITAP